MIIFNPAKFALLVLGKDFFKKKILTTEMGLKKFVMSAILKASSLQKREVDATVYKVVDKYENSKCYSIEGVRHDKQPATPGVYINGNRKVLVK